MGIIITILIIGGIAGYFYFKIIKPQLSGKVGQAYTEGQAEFEANKERIMSEYFADENRFGMFKEVIPDEEIIGIASFAEPKTAGKALLEEVKTAATGVVKVNMGMYFLVVTPVHLHAIGFNGENSFMHDIFDMNEIQGASVSKAGGLNLQDQLTGQNANLDKFKFTYKGTSYSFNLFRAIAGFPKFDVEKNLAGGFDRVFKYGAVNGADATAMLSKEWYVDFCAKDVVYQGFKNEIQTKLNVVFPA